MPRFFRYSSNSYMPLKNNPKHQLAQNHALNLYEKEAIYSFIPKNACSSLRTTLAYVNGCIKSKDDFNWIHKNNPTFTANLGELIRAKYTFTVLRCPFSRLVSVYLDKIVSRNTVAWQYTEILNRSVDINDITFSEFVKSMVKPAIRDANIHWRPQVDFLVYEEYDDYFALEDFKQLEISLKSRLDIDVIDARPLTKHGLDGYEYIEAKQLWDASPLELLNHKMQGRIPDPKEIYNEDLINIVMTVYQNDIKLYREKFGPNQLMY